MLSEQCSMFKEMAEFMEEYAKEKNYILNSDERELLSIAYRHYILNERSAYRTSFAYEEKEKKKTESICLLL